MLVDLTREEISAIAEDCECDLESNHIQPIEECEDLAGCPLNHFDLRDPFSLDENPGKSERELEILMRQRLLKKLDEALKGQS